MKWTDFPRYWPFVRGNHRSPVNSPHKGQWRGALIFYLICAWINGWVNNREAGDLRRHRVHYDVTVMLILMADVWGISYRMALRWMRLYLTDDKSSLVQAMAWCLQAISHYLNQCWPRSVSPYGASRPQSVQLRFGAHFALILTRSSTFWSCLI